ncbi:hypothetical protein [Bacillus sp. PS06]|uniref:hypothetical protein n=1 Tax=Bacillus sp. PS06 TaxID=2764176 RepID=UPI0017863C12|nr:hypothetical protein [Bacillus sp. PS06]MBD8068521.1 hypothetical protein [Bacillus sp. PS06]
MIIRKSNDVEQFLTEFSRFATYDSDSSINKYYFVFHDKERGGQITLMRTDNGWSYHGLGEGYCDPGETEITTEEGRKLVWLHRKAINQSIKDSLVTS